MILEFRLGRYRSIFLTKNELSREYKIETLIPGFKLLLCITEIYIKFYESWFCVYEVLTLLAKVKVDVK